MEPDIDDETPKDSHDQCPMDPLLAAEFHNVYHSPVGRLPDELVLDILRCLGDDIVALHCLRQVSRKFRRLICSRDIWRYLGLPESSKFNPVIPRDMWSYSKDQREQLRQHLRRDMVCNKCLLNSNVSTEGHQGAKFSFDGYLLCSRHNCPFRTQRRREITQWFCYACGRNHDPDTDFVGHSIRDYEGEEEEEENKEEDEEELEEEEHRGECLAFQGAVRLCEHVSISWDAIMTYVAKQRADRGHLEVDGPEWRAWLDSFKVECHDPSHDTRCSAATEPTWPKATLRGDGEDGVELRMVWSPHSGINAVRLTFDGRAPASDLRALFAKYRQGAAKFFLPAYSSNSLPEMACFPYRYCKCLYVETGNGGCNNDDQITTCARREKSLFQGRMCAGSLWVHLYERREYERGGWVYEGVGMSRHWAGPLPTSVCLVTNYIRKVRVCENTDHLNPSHEWFHAMDPDTYDYPGAVPPCRDEDCMNYHRRPVTSLYW